MSLDPICRRPIHNKQSEWLLVHKGEAYHFCCSACKQAFAAAPDAAIAAFASTQFIDAPKPEVAVTNMIPELRFASARAEPEPAAADLLIALAA